MRYEKGIPEKSQLDFGEIIPTFGRTQYFLGDVVLTCQYHIAIEHSVLKQQQNNFKNKIKLYGV
jgi:hypothetical protein